MTYTTLKQALQRASRSAIKSQDYRHVVCEAGEYDVISDSDLDEFYIGARVLYTADPDGWLSQS